MSYTTQLHMRVYDDSNGHYIKVSPDRDGLGLVELSTDGESAEWFGKIKLSMSPELAQKLSDAIHDVARHVQGNPL